jgi:hypothetical protein
VRALPRPKSPIPSPSHSQSIDRNRTSEIFCAPEETGPFNMERSHNPHSALTSRMFCILGAPAILGPARSGIFCIEPARNAVPWRLKARQKPLPEVNHTDGGERGAPHSAPADS